MPNFPQMPEDTHPFSDQNNSHNEKMIVSCTHTKVLLTSKLLCMTLLLKASPTYKSWRNLTALLCIRLTDQGLLLQRTVKTKQNHKTKRLEQFNEHSFFYLPALLTHFLQSATTEFKVFTSIIKKKQVSALMRRHSKQIIGRGRSQRSGVKLTTKFNVTDHMTSSYLF